MPFTKPQSYSSDEESFVVKRKRAEYYSSEDDNGGEAEEGQRRITSSRSKGVNETKYKKAKGTKANDKRDGDGEDKNGSDEDTVATATMQSATPPVVPTKDANKTHSNPWWLSDKIAPPSLDACISFLKSRGAELPYNATTSVLDVELEEWNTNEWSTESLAREIITLEVQQNNNARTLALYRERLAKRLKRELRKGQEALDALLEENQRE